MTGVCLSRLLSTPVGIDFTPGGFDFTRGGIDFTAVGLTRYNHRVKGGFLTLFGSVGLMVAYSSYLFNIELVSRVLRSAPAFLRW